MKAVVRQDPFTVAAEQVPSPRIEAANRALARITSSICESDLHTHEGRAKVLLHRSAL